MQPWKDMYKSIPRAVMKTDLRLTSSLHMVFWALHVYMAVCILRILIYGVAELITTL